MARKGYPAEFRWRALDLVAAGEPVAEVARLLEVSDRSMAAGRAVRRSRECSAFPVSASTLGGFGRRRRARDPGRPQGGRDVDAARRHCRPQWSAQALRDRERCERGRSRRPRLHSRAAQPALGTDISEHPTGEGKVFCAVVLDAFSRRVLGWSTNHNPTAALTSNALGMAIEQRDAQRGETVIHRDHGTQFTSSAFTERARQSGLLPSVGSVGDCYDTQLMMAPVALRFAV